MAKQQPPKNTVTQQSVFTLQKRRGPLRRLGCAVALILWFMVLLTPCFLIVMATQGEIVVRLGDVPGQSFRIWLVNESRQRGLGISRPSIIANENEYQRCLQTNVSFILWAGTAEGSTYCECYTQPDNTGEWELTSNQQGACQP